MCNFTSFLPEGILTRRFFAGNVDSSGATISSGVVGSTFTGISTVEGCGVVMKAVPTSDSGGDVVRSSAVVSACCVFGTNEDMASSQESQDFKNSTALPSVDSFSAGSRILVKEGCKSLGTSHAESSFRGNMEVISRLSSEVRSTEVASACTG